MEEVYKQVDEFLEYIKKEMEAMGLNANEVFLNGNCGNLYKLLVAEFYRYTTPFVITNREIPYHIITKIGNKFYDITGETDLNKYIEYIKNANIREKYKTEDFGIKQLSVADELIDKMCDMYKYNEEYEQSEIASEMFKLTKKIKNMEAPTRY